MKKETAYPPTLCRRRAYGGDLFKTAQNMIADLIKIQNRKLAVHPDKTPILTNQELTEQEVEIHENVEMLPSEGKAKYLAQMITFVDQETTWVQCRIGCAWSAFARHRQELTSQPYSQRHRLHLFDAVVTPTITYGAGTWTTRGYSRRRQHTMSATKTAVSHSMMMKRASKPEHDLEDSLSM